MSPGFNVHIAGLKKGDSDELYKFLVQQLEGVEDLRSDGSGRWRLAMWDGIKELVAIELFEGSIRRIEGGGEYYCFWERPYFEERSVGREEQEIQLAEVKGEKIRVEIRGGSSSTASVV